MRRSHVLFIAVALAACSSSTTGTGNPPPQSTPRILISAASIGAGGGTLRYTKAGDPLDGLTVTVPAGAFTAAQSWTITADSSIVVPLPVDVIQVGPALLISNGTGYAEVPVTLTMPMAIGPDTSVAPFYFDQVSKKLEGIPMVDFTASYATLVAEHFSTELTALGGPTQTALRSENSFGSVVVVWVKTANSKLQGTYSSSFAPGTNDWEFTNYGDYVAPEGDCEGMSISALYYKYFVTGGAGLYHKYDLSVINQWDNVQGIRFAGSVQGDLAARVKAGLDQIFDLNTIAINKGATVTDRIKSLTANWLMLTFKTTREPVLVAFWGTAGGHAVVAYSGTMSGSQTTISFADPNYPGTARSMTYQNGTLDPVSLQLNASDPATDFTRSYALGVTADVPLRSLDNRYAEFKLGTAGRDRYPSAYSWASYNYATGAYDGITGVIQSNNDKFFPALLCAGCTAKLGSTPVDRQQVLVYDANGQYQVPVNAATGDVNLLPGSNTFVLKGNPKSPFSSTKATGFLDSKTVTVFYNQPDYSYTLSSSAVTVYRGSSVKDTFNFTRTNYTGPISLGVNGTITGVSFAATPQPVSGNQSVLTISASSNADLGPHTVTVTGNTAELAQVVRALTITVAVQPAFTIAVTSAPLNVVAGSSAQDTLTIDRTNFSSSISLTDSADAGITVTANPASTPGSLLPFTVNVAPGVAGGTHIVKLIATGAGLPAVSTTFAVVVASPAAYSLSVATAPLAIHVNSFATDLVTITRTGSFTGPVTLSATADSANITVAASPSGSTSGNQVSLIVNVGSGASVGTHIITIRGVAADQVDKLSTFAVVVSIPTTQAGAPASIVITPLNSTRTPGTTQLFTAYLLDASGNRTFPAAGWGISILSDNSNAATDLASTFDNVNRWETHVVLANGLFSTPVRAAYYRLSDGASTFVAIATFTVVP